MSQTPLDLLLDEAKGLYKAEAERYGHLYGRIGVYMAVFAIYTNALVWFFQNGQHAVARGVLFTVALAALFLLTGFGFGCLIFALWGNKFSAPLKPSFWVERRDELRQPVFEALLAEGVAAPSEDQIEARVVTALKDDLVDDLTRCTELNINVNERRFGFVHRSSQCAGVGFFALLCLVGSHVWTVWREPPQRSAAQVQVVEPVVVAPVNWPIRGTCDTAPEAARAEGATAPGGRSDEAPAPAAPANQGGTHPAEDAPAAVTK
jgi:hypothetical protein